VELLWGYLFIFGARVVDVAMATTRMLLVFRGRRLQAALIGFFEMIVYIVALNMVVQNLDQIGNLLMYALGFATGTYVGSYVEERMALGHVTVQVIPKDKNITLAAELREQGYGVTVVNGWGKEGTRQLLTILVKRKNLPQLMRTIDDLDHDSFVTVMETRFIHGGYLGRKGK
jgi:uncharacterized protein YebE (UPF0316 family)